jgi:beta-glucanase (GH16 family)
MLIKIKKGNLVIEARKENSAHYQCWYGTCQYTSARLNTNTHFNVKYGRIEARIKIPNAQGLWPAFWLLGTNIASAGWPACGEIDVMEHIGRTPTTIYGTIHGPNLSGTSPYGFGGTYTLPRGHVADNYHIYAVQWDNSQISFFVDNVKYSTVTKANALQRNGQWVFDHPFYIILNNAIGGSWPHNPDQTTVFPQKMYVDYVRVYQ